MKRRRSLGVFSALIVTSVASSALGHITLVEPTPRHPADDLKFGPCGVRNNDSRTTDPARITTYTAGDTITVRWTETINHPSHFRIALAATDAEFVDPTGFDDTSGGPNVLLDGIEDPGAPSGAEYEVQVTLPSEPCPECTLQLIQVMKDKQPWGNGDDIYYQCADLVIEPGTPEPTGGSGGTLGSGGAPSGSGGTLATGGVASGGAAAGGGVATGGVATGGASTGGASAVGGAPTASGGEGFDEPAASDSDEGGGCQASRGPLPTGPSAALWLALGVASLRRFRRSWY